MLSLLFALLGCDDGAPTRTDGIAEAANTVTDTDGGTSETEPPPEVSWYADIEPLLDENCLSCHADAGISFSLEDPVIAAAMGDVMVDAVSSGRMPPWPAREDGCQPLQGTRTLDEDQIALLARWVELGAPEGRPEDAPADTEDADERPFEADISLTLPEPFVPSLDQEDDYRCFVLDAGLTDTTYVTGIDVEPGNASIVHHVILYTDPGGVAAKLDAADDEQGYQCFGGPGFDNTGVIGGWAPGQGTIWLPEGVGLQLSPGVPIVAQIHYHPVNDPGAADQTQIALDTEDSVETQGFLLPLASQGLDIPAGEPSHVETRTVTFNYGLSGRLWGGTPHMHLLGKSISVTHTPAGSDESHCLMDIPEWDFDYQNFYLFEEPYLIEDGSSITLECVYDNSAENPNQPNDPPLDVGWGDGTADEMCLAFALISL